MHEATIAQSILEIVFKRLNQTFNAEGALKVHVLAGEFRNIDSESLQFAFDSLKTLYHGLHSCQLEITVVEAYAFCQDGHHQYHPRFEEAFLCQCGSGIGTLIRGEELDVVNITLAAALCEENKSICTTQQMSTC